MDRKHGFITVRYSLNDTADEGPVFMRHPVTYRIRYVDCGGTRINYGLDNSTQKIKL